MTITICKVPGWDAQFVEVNGIKRGIIRPDNSGGFVAEKMGCYKTSKPQHVFGWYGTKQRAIDAIVTATKDQPAYVVFPEQDEQTCRNWHALGVANR
jgi:hypothetical protein